MSEWQFEFLLQNVSVAERIETNYVALVPTSDPRVQSLIGHHASISHFVKRFFDQYQRQISPSILLVRNDAPETVLNNDALVAFRNVIAISCILDAWQQVMNRQVPQNIARFSNYFDIYPMAPHRDREYIVYRSPVLRGLDNAKDFVGQTTPELSFPATEISYDRKVFSALIKEWGRRYVKGKLSEWKTRVLFRSLEMAYQASAVPYKNNSTIYDYGTGLALWVSAFEVLVHPRSGQSDVHRVLELLGQAPFDSRDLKNRYYSFSTGKRKTKNSRITLPQKLYTQIHRARNEFLHGNPVQLRDLFPFKDTARRPLNHYAPILYNVALWCFLGLYRNVDLSKLDTDDFANYMGIEEAILSCRLSAKTMFNW